MLLVGCRGLMPEVAAHGRSAAYEMLRQWNDGYGSLAGPRADFA